MTTRQLIEFAPADLTLIVTCKECKARILVEHLNIRQCGCGHAFDKECKETIEDYFHFRSGVAKCLGVRFILSVDASVDEEES